MFIRSLGDALRAFVSNVVYSLFTTSIGRRPLARAVEDSNMTSQISQFDTDKLCAAIAYLVEKTSPGKLKLFKLLYLSDFRSYVIRGSSITGEEYEHYDLGPVPRMLRENFDEIAAKCVHVTPESVGAPNHQLTMRIRDGVTFEALTPEDINILDAVIMLHGSKTGVSLTNLTHSEIPYRATRRGEVIPYYLAPYRYHRKLTPSEVATITSNPSYADRIRAALNEEMDAATAENSEFAAEDYPVVDERIAVLG